MKEKIKPPFELKIMKNERVDDYIVVNIDARIVGDKLDSNRIFIGIDPGITNIGVAKIMPKKNMVLLHKLKFDRIKDAVQRMTTLTMFLHERIYATGQEVLVVEGASYANPYRQVELAEARTVMAMWGVRKGMDVKIVPPNTIRKVAFGSAKIKNPWEGIPDDCSAALGCALYGYKTM